MRTAMLFTLLIAIQAQSAERTWTIARDVYQADGELVAVRRDLAYLKINGKVEEIPLDRLSATDQQYISSLSFAPILPGPASDAEIAASAAAQPASIGQEEMPLPGSPGPPREDEYVPREPELAPAYGGAPIRQPGAVQPPYRFDRYGRTVPPQSGTQANYVAPFGDPRAANNANDRRNRRPPQQQDENDRARSDRDDDDDRGIFGFRARRQERERAAANRSR